MSSSAALGFTRRLRSIEIAVRLGRFLDSFADACNCIEVRELIGVR
jgi:hypothetical protein